jgi:hypothetical protein
MDLGWPTQLVSSDVILVMAGLLRRRNRCSDELSL